MFRQDPQGVLRVEPLSGLHWLEHGFGTRQAAGWPAPERSVTLRQLHSDIGITADGRTGCLGEGDALITDRPGILLTIRTADCLPILLVDQKRRVVAAVHAGWRGTVKEISAKIVRRLREDFTSDPVDLVAAIGPGIGGCCFEVGPEVAEQFPAYSWREEGKVDLLEVNRRQLVSAGLSPDHIFSGALCTACTPESFHSYRRDRSQAGRMISAIGLTP